MPRAPLALVALLVILLTAPAALTGQQVGDAAASAVPRIPSNGPAVPAGNLVSIDLATGAETVVDTGGTRLDRSTLVPGRALPGDDVQPPGDVGPMNFGTLALQSNYLDYPYRTTVKLWVTQANARWRSAAAC